MDFTHSPKTLALLDRVQAFMAEHVYPNEELRAAQLKSAADRWAPVPIVEALKARARAEGSPSKIATSAELSMTSTNPRPRTPNPTPPW